jgi:hypothetical protein
MTDLPAFLDRLGHDLVEKRTQLVRRRRRRRAMASGVAVVLAVTGLMVTTVVDSEPDEHQVVTRPEPILPPSQWTWEQVTGLPSLSTQGEGVAQWFGEKIFVWSTEEAVIFDPATGRTTDVARPPSSVPLTGRSVWTGREVIVVGGSGTLGSSANGLAYDPARDRWRALPASPVSWHSPTVVVWTGDEAIFWGEQFRSADVTRAGAAYDPRANTWRRIAEAPIGLNLGNGVWTGGRVVIVGSDLDGNNWARMPLQMLTYDPRRDRWERGPEPPLSPQATHLVWNGQLVLWDYLLGAAVFDPVPGAWRALPEVPLRSQECYPGGTVVGSTPVMVYCGQYAAFDTATGKWVVLRTGFDSGTLVGPGQVLTFGPDGAERLVTR